MHLHDIHRPPVNAQTLRHFREISRRSEVVLRHQDTLLPVADFALDASRSGGGLLMSLMRQDKNPSVGLFVLPLEFVTGDLFLLSGLCM